MQNGVRGHTAQCVPEMIRKRNRTEGAMTVHGDYAALKLEKKKIRAPMGGQSKAHNKDNGFRTGVGGDRGVMHDFG